MFRSTWRVRVASALTVCAVGGGLLVAAGPAGAATPTRLTAHLSGARVSQGVPVHLSGSVAPARHPRRVALQRYTGGRWHVVVRSVSSAGRYRLRVPTTRLGRATYRVRAVATSSAARAASARLVLHVTAYSDPAAYAVMSDPPPRWDPCTPIGYRVNLQRAGTGALADVTGAVARLSAATGLTYTYRGTTTVVPGDTDASDAYPADTRLVIAWVQPGETRYLAVPQAGATGAAGVGGASWTNGIDQRGRSWGLIRHGFVVLDATLHLTAGFGTGPVWGWQGTRGQLLMHELGHSAGLDHPVIPDQTEIMYPTMTRKVAVWGAGDRTGLRIVGASSGGCLTSARAAWTAQAPTLALLGELTEHTFVRS